MAKPRRILNRFAGASMLVFLAVFCVGFGFLIGYRFIVHQTQKYEAFDEAASRASARKTAPSTATVETDANGETIEAMNTETQAPKTGDQVELVDQDTPGAIMIYVNSGDRASDIAKKLVELKVIKDPSLFTLLSKMNGFDGSYRSGTHFVKADMSYDEIMYALSRDPATVSVTFAEGTTYKEFKSLLRSKGVRFDEEKMDALVNNCDTFSDYSFVREIPKNPDRLYALQGYLFPDTYFFDLNTDEENLLRRVLDNTKQKLLPEYYERAKAIGMTMDQVITLASIIEAESSELADRYKVSRVFHNRLDKGDYLQSCATVNFLRKEKGLEPIFIVGEDDLKMDSPYNTYLYPGLPPGPICSPGIEAIRAALYPDNEDPDIYFFVSKGDGTNYFTRYYGEHEEAVEKYLRPLQDKVEEEEQQPDPDEN